VRPSPLSYFGVSGLAGVRLPEPSCCQTVSRSGSFTVEPAAGSTVTPAQQDVVRQSTQLLLTTFYRKISAEEIIANERDGLTAYLRAHGAAAVKLPAPIAVDAKNAGDAAIAQIDAAVETGKISSDAAVSTAVKAMASAAHDRYTTYFTHDEYKAFDEILDPTKLSGIGVLMDVDPATKYLRAFFVVPDTPADRGGLKSGDDIRAVDGHSTLGLTVAQGRQYLLGTSGTEVRLSGAHGDAGLDALEKVAEAPLERQAGAATDERVGARPSAIVVALPYPAVATGPRRRAPGPAAVRPWPGGR